MASELPQISNTQPALSVQKVESKAEGYDEFGRVLGSLASNTEKKAESVAEEASNAQLMQSASMMEDLKTTTHIEMLKNPDQAEKILANMQTTTDSIKQSAYVNDVDRGKLDYLINQDTNQLKLKAAETSVQQNNRNVAISFWDSYPTNMKSIQDSLDAGDFEKAKILEDTLHKAALGAASIGAITPEQLSTIRKASLDTYERTQDLIALSKQENASAHDFHTLAASPFSNNNFANTNYPVNESTKQLTGHYNYDRTMAGQEAALYNGDPINFGVIAGASEEQYEKFKQQMYGVNTIKGAIHSGTPYNQIENHITDLQGKPQLSPEETAQVNYWKGFKNKLNRENGYVEMMSQTTIGGQFAQDYNAQRKALENSAKSPAEKAAALRDNDNNFIGQMVDLGLSQHVDPNYIKPIPGQWVAAVQSSFNKDAPVAPALERIAYVKPEYRAYLANQIEKPHQAMAVWLTGLTMGQTDASFQADMIAANQDRDFSSLQTDKKDQTKSTNIWQDITSNDNMKTIYRYLGKLPGGDKAQKGFQEASTNYVMYQAQKYGDVDLRDKTKYESDFVQNAAKGFNLVAGSSYLMNANDLQLRKTDMDYLANHALSEAHTALHQGRTEAEFQAFVDLNPLMVISTPDRRIVVIDRYGRAAAMKNGQPAFDHPYTQNMLHAAHATHQKQQETGEYVSHYYGLIPGEY